MITQNFSTHQVLSSFRECKSLFLQSWPKRFIRFLCKCKENLLKGNRPSLKKSRDKNSRHIEMVLCKKINLEDKKGSSGIRKWFKAHKSYCSSSHLFWHRALITASRHKKSLNTQSVTTQELPKYQASQNPTFQNDWLKNEINNFFLPKQTLW